MTRPAVFLDRDGVLVEEVFYSETGEWEGPLSPNDVRLVPGAAASLRKLAAFGLTTVLVSNQGGYAKGKTTLRALWLAHERFIELLAAEGVALSGFFYSYGHPDGAAPYFGGPSLDRKPSPYNVLIAAAQLDLDLSRSWMVGDRESDILCAQAAGVSAILIENAHNPVARSDAIRTRNLAEAVKYICSVDTLASGRGESRFLRQMIR